MKKLILAIINNDDSAIVAAALTREGYFVTKLSTTGGFLMVGNTTLLIGTDADKIEDIKAILRKHCSTRIQANPSCQAFGRDMGNNGLAEEVTVGGATLFVLSVEDFEKL